MRLLHLLLPVAIAPPFAVAVGCGSEDSVPGSGASTTAGSSSTAGGGGASTTATTSASGGGASTTSGAGGATSTSTATTTSNSSSSAGGGGDQDGGKPDGCAPKSNDPGAIGSVCASDQDCPSGYTCWGHNGIVFQELCEIICEADCDCPSGYSCKDFSDKGGTWMACSQ